MNKVILMGRLTRDPEVRYSAGNNSMAVARYTLAVDRRFRRDGENNADFIGCVAFGKSAEFAEKYLRQGTKIIDWPDSDWQLHESGWPEGLHDRCGSVGPGICRE